MYRERMGMSRGSTHSRLLWRRMATNTICRTDGHRNEPLGPSGKKRGSALLFVWNERGSTWATTSEMEAEPTMTLYLCLRSIPAWIQAWGENKGALHAVPRMHENVGGKQKSGEITGRPGESERDFHSRS